MLLQNAGSETTRNLITTGTLALLPAPRPAGPCCGPTSTCSPLAIEELLRYVTPVIHFTRTPVCRHRARGPPDSAGERVLMVYASANRDERAFKRPRRARPHP